MPRVQKEELQLEKIDSPRGFPLDGISLFTDDSEKLKIRTANGIDDEVIATEKVLSSAIESAIGNVNESIKLGDGLIRDDQNMITLKPEYLSYLARQTFVAPSLNRFELRNGTQPTNFSGTKEIGYKYSFSNLVLSYSITGSINKVILKALGQTKELTQLTADVQFGAGTISTSKTSPQTMTLGEIIIYYTDSDNNERTISRSITVSTNYYTYFGRWKGTDNDETGFAEAFENFTSRWGYSGNYSVPASSDVNDRYIWFCFEKNNAANRINNMKFKNVNTGFEVAVNRDFSYEIGTINEETQTEIVYQCFRTVTPADSAITVSIS